MESIIFSKVIELLPDMHDPRVILSEILNVSNEELCDKFKHYGNSYTDPQRRDRQLWRKRLANEVQEYTQCLTPAERKRQLTNLFYLAWMAYGYELMMEGKKICASSRLRIPRTCLLPG